MTATTGPATAAPGEGEAPAAVAGTIHGPECFTDEQRQWFLSAINPRRVNKEDGKGHSHVVAYEIRAHLNRMFGFANWSVDVEAVDLVVEDPRTHDKTGEATGKWDVLYRAVVRLIVHCPHGRPVATYADVATGSGENQGRFDAHDLALKTAVSTALKRAATNLGDQFGLSLYKKGQLAPLVGNTLVGGKPQAGPPDAHITESPPETDASREPQQDDPNEPVDPPAWDDASDPPEGVTDLGDGRFAMNSSDSSPRANGQRAPADIKADAEKYATEYGPEELKQHLLDLMTELTQMRGHAGTKATVRVFLIEQMKIAEKAMPDAAKP